MGGFNNWKKTLYKTTDLIKQASCQAYIITTKSIFHTNNSKKQIQMFLKTYIHVEQFKFVKTVIVLSKDGRRSKSISAQLKMKSNWSESYRT